MRFGSTRTFLATGVLLLPMLGSVAGATDNVQLGPRPYYLVADMDEGPLKTTL